jgi:FKBP-type peptidyl-prolyl cis-trans isomerase 2
VLFALLIAACSGSDAPIADFPGAGRELSLELSSRLDDGREVEASTPDEPLVLRLGEGRLPLALERQLGSLVAGDEREIALEAADAYGERAPELLRPVPLDRIPEDHREAGKMVLGESPDGEQRMFRVHEIRDEEAILDLNHPLAGERIHFRVKVLSAD